MTKVPANAVRVFEGKLHDVYHWDQPMFDGTIQTFEMLKRRPSVTIIAVTSTGSIIVNDEQQPFNGRCFCLPGGVSESDDLLKDAKRELEEETGYTSNQWSFFTKIDVLEYSKIEWESYFYIAKQCEPSGAVKLDSGEDIVPMLYDFDEFIKIVQSETFSNTYIKDYIKTLTSNTQEMLRFKKDILGLTP